MQVESLTDSELGVVEAAVATTSESRGSGTEGTVGGASVEFLQAASKDCVSSSLLGKKRKFGGKGEGVGRDKGEGGRRRGGRGGDGTYIKTSSTMGSR